MKKSKLGKLLGISFGAFFVVAAVYFSVVYALVFRPSFMRRNVGLEYSYFDSSIEYWEKHNEDVDWFEKQNVKKLGIVSFDGLRLIALNLQKEDAKGTAILMHGWRSLPLRDCVTIARLFYEEGYNVVLPYQRTHGESEGKYITFGVKEKEDLLDWIEFINRMYGRDKPVIIGGVSMGCSTVEMALGSERMPENVCAAVADCGFTSPRSIIWKVIKDDYKLPTGKLIFNYGNFLTNILCKFDMSECVTTEELSKTNVPVLFITGDADKFVPPLMTYENFSACSSKKSMKVFEGVPHAMSCYYYTEEYYDCVKKFISEVLN